MAARRPRKSPSTRLLVERTAVGEDVGGHGDLAAIVKPASETRELDGRSRQLQFERQRSTPWGQLQDVGSTRFTVSVGGFAAPQKFR